MKEAGTQGRTSRVPRLLRLAVQTGASAGLLAYILWRIDLGSTADWIGRANPFLLLAALAVFGAGTLGLAWRWQYLLAVRGLREPLGWLTSLYFVGYAVGQLVPTGLGGDAVRIVEHARRRPGRVAEVAAAVVVERVLGVVGVLVVAAIGLALAAGRYEGILLLVWIELGGVALVAAGCFALFSVRARRGLRRLRPAAAKLRIERLARSLYEAIHVYRSHLRALVLALAATVLLQLVRIVPIWLCGEAVGLDLSPSIYVVLGAFLSFVMLVPFTLNGVGVREAFVVAFLGRFDVDAEAAFATGILFYAITVATSAPGALVLLWRSVRPRRTPIEAER